MINPRLHRTIVRVSTFIVVFVLTSVLLAYLMVFFAGYGIDSVEMVNEPEASGSLEFVAAPVELRTFTIPEGVQFPDLAHETWAYTEDNGISELYADDFAFSFERGSFSPEKSKTVSEETGRFHIKIKTTQFVLFVNGPIERFQESDQLLEKFLLQEEVSN